MKIVKISFAVFPILLILMTSPVIAQEPVMVHVHVTDFWTNNGLEIDFYSHRG